MGSSSLLAAAPALAQQASTAPAQIAAADVPQPGEIIVTATKRSESLQKVPISIQALSPEVLSQHQVAAFDDYAKLLPSVSYQSFGPGQSQLYFRGIATGGDGLQSGPLPTAGLYIDEIPVTTIFGSVDMHAYDIARVEALSGPQGTLYGASSLAGTLRVITNKPDTSKFSAGYDLEGNKFGKGNGGGKAEGFVNVPLGEKMAIRLVGFYEKDGGYIDNTHSHGRTVFNPITGQYEPNRPYRRTTPGFLPDGSPNPAYFSTAPLPDDFFPDNAKFVKKDFNSVETYGGRAALKVDLSDNWTATPSVIYQHQKAKGTFLYDPRAGDLQVHDFTPDHNKDHWYIASLTLQGKVSDWDVTYSGSYFNRTVDNVQDYSYFSVAYDATYNYYNFYKDALGNDIDPTQTYHAHDTYTKQSHEFRISSPVENRWRLTAGMFLQRQTNDHIADYIIPGLSTAVNPFSPPVPGSNGNDVFFTDIHRVDRDYAVFGEASYDILENLTVTAGIRGFMAKNTLYGFSGGAGAVDRQITLFGCTGTIAQQCPNINKKYNETGETHKVNLSWKIDPARMVYFTYSTGFRPGGNNRDAFALGQLQSYPPYRADTITNYEVGWKTSWLDRTLRFNGALFWEEWNNVQYSEPGILGIFYTVNAGKARSRGVEGDINWTLFHHLTLSTSGTYVDAKLTEDFCAFDPALNITPRAPCTNGVLAPKGTRLPVQPKFKINATARYEFETGALKNFLQAGVNHQSGTLSYLTTAGEAVLGPTKGFTTFDFSAGTGRGNWTLSAFIQNAFDKRGILSKNSVCAPTICGQYARLYPIKPQFFGLRFGQKF
ncbi:MAG TPA: TonB-dependent receptor [Sphingomonas sp.]|nr:TonB-dependent receptor [Sphingomonas sp.]